MSKKVLVIGAGVNQCPVIKIAKDFGYYVISVTPKGNYPGMALSDEVFDCDIFDKERVLEFAKEKGIDGVLTDQSDNTVMTAAYVAEQLGLPGFGYEAAISMTDKHKMREVLVTLGLNVAPNDLVYNVEAACASAAKIGYPVVSKPIDSYSSHGVLMSENEEELRENFEIAMSFSRKKAVIVEKFIEGPQFFSQGYVEDYKLKMFAYSDRYYYDIPNVFIPYTNAFPAKISDELRDKMNEDFSKVIDYLKPEYGHVWAEWIQDDKTGELYIIEMAIRGAGAFVTTDVIPAAYGVDTQPYLVREAMGDSEESIFGADFKDNAAAFYSFLLPEGKVTSVEGLDKVAELKGVIKATLKDVKVGDVIPPIMDKSSRYGNIVVAGKSRDELDEIMVAVKDTIKIKVLSDGVEKYPIWE